MVPKKCLSMIIVNHIQTIDWQRCLSIDIIGNNICILENEHNNDDDDDDDDYIITLAHFPVIYPMITKQAIYNKASRWKKTKYIPGTKYEIIRAPQYQ